MRLRSRRATPSAAVPFAWISCLPTSLAATTRTPGNPVADWALTPRQRATPKAAPAAARRAPAPAITQVVTRLVLARTVTVLPAGARAPGCGACSMILARPSFDGASPMMASSKPAWLTSRRASSSGWVRRSGTASMAGPSSARTADRTATRVPGSGRWLTTRAWVSSAGTWPRTRSSRRALRVSCRASGSGCWRRSGTRTSSGCGGVTRGGGGEGGGEDGGGVTGGGVATCGGVICTVRVLPMRTRVSGAGCCSYTTARSGADGQPPETSRRRRAARARCTPSMSGRRRTSGTRTHCSAGGGSTGGTTRGGTTPPGGVGDGGGPEGGEIGFRTDTTTVLSKGTRDSGAGFCSTTRADCGLAGHPPETSSRSLARLMRCWASSSDCRLTSGTVASSSVRGGACSVTTTGVFTGTRVPAGGFCVATVARLESQGTSPLTSSLSRALATSRCASASDRGRSSGTTTRSAVSKRTLTVTAEPTTARVPAAGFWLTTMAWLVSSGAPPLTSSLRRAFSTSGRASMSDFRRRSGTLVSRLGTTTARDGGGCDVLGAWTTTVITLPTAALVFGSGVCRTTITLVGSSAAIFCASASTCWRRSGTCTLMMAGVYARPEVDGLEGVAVSANAGRPPAQTTGTSRTRSAASRRDGHGDGRDLRRPDSIIAFLRELARSVRPEPLARPWTHGPFLHAEGHVLRRPLLEEIGIRLLRDARHAGGRHLAGTAQHDLRLAQVVVVEVGRGEDVPRVGEVGQGGQLRADRPAHRALQHPADPAGDAVLGAQGLDVAGGGEAAHAGHLDVDDLAAAQANSGPHVREALGALVETHGRLDGPLEIGVVDEAHTVVGQRLFDHGEMEAVEVSEHLGVRRRVGGVAVDVEGVAREGRSHRLDHGQVPARPVLELDAREALVDGDLDLLEQDVDGILYAEVRSHRYPVAGAAEGAVQRKAAALGVEHPPGDLQRSAGELIALDQGKAIEEILRRLDVLPDDPRRHVLAHGVKRGERVLRRIAGQQGRTAFAPRRVAAAFHAHEDGVGVILIRVGSLPDEGEGNPRPVDVDALDLHA